LDKLIIHCGLLIRAIAIEEVIKKAEMEKFDKNDEKC